MEGKFPRMCHKHLPREASKGMLFKLVSYGPFLGSPPEIPGPKVNSENCLLYPCMAKKWNRVKASQ